MLVGKTILITGGGSGIGEALASILSTHNKVIITGRNEDKLKRVASANRNVSYYVSDISVTSEIDLLFKKISSDGIVLNVLINNAGIAQLWDIGKTSLSSEQIFESLNTNMTGAIAATQQFIHQADRTNLNFIINVTSEVAIFPVSIMPLYSASKTGLSVFTKTLRILLKDASFKVIEILAPGVNTAMSKGLGNTGKLLLPSEFAHQIINVINKGKTEYAPGRDVTILKLFNKFLPKTGLKLIDKMSRRRLKLG